MELYKILSKNYDSLFPVSVAEIDFLEKHLAGKTSTLDIGCGTGGKTSMLASSSRRVTGIDCSGDMIAIAREKRSGENIEYRVLDMLGLSRAFSPHSFDSAVCLGNSIPHLVEPDQIPDLFKQVNGLLVRDGVFIGQIINFDRVVTQNVDKLPVIETDSVVFKRSYDWQGAEMKFCIELEDKENGTIERSEVPMVPLLKKSLESALQSAGFERITYYGSFSGEPYQEDCFHLIFKTTQVNP